MLFTLASSADSHCQAKGELETWQRSACCFCATPRQPNLGSQSQLMKISKVQSTSQSSGEARVLSAGPSQVHPSNPKREVGGGGSLLGPSKT